MSQSLYRLVYASRATFKPFATENGIDGNIAKILEESRINNEKRNLVGALYYGSGCFFQCLEGEKQDIDMLYAKLLQDKRHRDLKVLATYPIDKIGFASWEMKYATIDHEVRQFLKQHSIAKFDPYKFDESMTNELVSMLQLAEDSANAEALRLAATTALPKQNNYLLYLVFLAALIAFVVYMFVQI